MSSRLIFDMPGLEGCSIYQALYRRWRPTTFSEVVGQQHVTDTLRRQVAAGRLSHAYIFTGTRGTGKTSCAKLLSKAANCLNPQNGEPCNRCAACLGINDGSLTDVIEIDAASNSGVDNIRAIREQSVYTPASLKYRVYIIDECHMLSTGAFNALLKTLEEPPAHLMFILATTELRKVPATILSRCQQFSFRRISAELIRARLEEIAAGEDIALLPEASGLIARLADGGLRDAVSMLDQCAAVGGTVDEALVRSMLGCASRLDTLLLAQALSSRDAAAALRLFTDIYAGGSDISALFGELSALFRDVLIFKTTGDPMLMTGGYTEAELNSLRFERLHLIAMLSELSDVTALAQRGASPRLEAELCLLRLCDEALGAGGSAALAARVERLEALLEKGLPVMPAETYSPVPPAAAIGKQAEADRPPWDDDDDTPSPPPPPKAAPAREPSAKPTAAKQSGDQTALKWPEILSALKPQITNMGQYSHLALIKSPKLEGSILTLPVSSDFSKKMLNRPDLLELIGRTAGRILGTELTVRVKLPSEMPEEKTEQTAPDISFNKLLSRSALLDNFTIDD